MSDEGVDDNEEGKKSKNQFLGSPDILTYNSFGTRQCASLGESVRLPCSNAIITNINQLVDEIIRTFRRYIEPADPYNPAPLCQTLNVNWIGSSHFWTITNRHLIHDTSFLTLFLLFRKVIKAEHLFARIQQISIQKIAEKLIINVIQQLRYEVCISIMSK